MTKCYVFSKRQEPYLCFEQHDCIISLLLTIAKEGRNIYGLFYLNYLPSGNSRYIVNRVIPLRMYSYIHSNIIVPLFDQSLALYKDQIKMIFSQKWSSHKCSKPGYILAYIPEKLLI